MCWIEKNIPEIEKTTDEKKILRLELDFNEGVVQEMGNKRKIMCF